MRLTFLLRTLPVMAALTLCSTRAATDPNQQLRLAVQTDDVQAATSLLQQNANPNIKSIGDWSLLASAVNRHHTAMAALLLARHADANFRIASFSNNTILMLAAGKGYDDLINMLLAAGARSDAVNSDGRTALGLAVDAGCIACATALIKSGARLAKSERQLVADQELNLGLDKDLPLLVSDAKTEGADLERRNARGLTPLLEAARDAHIAALQALLQAGANRSATDSSGHDALRIAMDWGRLKVITALLDGGWNTNVKDQSGDTALLFAVSRNDPHLVPQLLHAGANPALRNAQGENALTLAIQLWHKTNYFRRYERKWSLFVIHVLLDAGANPNLQNSAGQTALEILATDGTRPEDIGIADAMLAKGARIDIPDNQHVTALDQAITSHAYGLLALYAQKFDLHSDVGVLVALAHQNQQDAIGGALNRGLDPNAADKTGETLLVAAASGSADDVVSLLLAKGADPDKPDKSGQTPLAAAATAGSTTSLKLLLAHGATFDRQSTALMLDLLDGIVHRGSNDAARAAVQTLIAAGAGVAGKDGDPRVPMVEAARTRDPAIVKALLAAGAPLDTQDRNGDSAASVAIDSRDPQLWTYISQQLPHVTRNGKSLPIFRMPGIVFHWISSENFNSTYVQEFVGKGADPNTRDPEGRPFLADVIDTHASTLIQYVLDHGANPSATWTDKTGRIHQILELTINRYDIIDTDLVQRLVNAGARCEQCDPDMVDRIVTEMMAVGTSDYPLRALKLLLNVGLNPQGASRADGTTPLFRLVSKATPNDLEAALLLLRHGYQPTTRELIAALASGGGDSQPDRSVIIPAMIQAGVSPDTVDTVYRKSALQVLNDAQPEFRNDRAAAILRRYGFGLPDPGPTTTDAQRSAADLSAKQDSLGTRSFHAGNYADAVIHFQAAVNLDPANLRALSDLALGYLKQGRYADAVWIAERVLAKAGNRQYLADAYYNIGVACEHADSEGYFEWATPHCDHATIGYLYRSYLSAPAAARAAELETQWAYQLAKAPYGSLCIAPASAVYAPDNLGKTRMLLLNRDPQDSTYYLLISDPDARHSAGIDVPVILTGVSKDSTLSVHAVALHKKPGSFAAMITPQQTATATSVSVSYGSGDHAEACKLANVSVAPGPP